MSSARSLATALADSPAADLVRRAADSQRVAEALAEAGLALPPNFDPLASGACYLRESTLVLIVGSSATAAKLRQSLPQLLGWLNRQGFELTEIKVRLQPERMSYRLSPEEMAAGSGGAGPLLVQEHAPLSVSGALELAEKLALTFPDSPVGAAARKLAEKLKRRVAQTG